MKIKIEVPCGSMGATIRLSDIVRVERCALSFFDNRVFNLYVIVRKDTEELFHLYSYKYKDKMETAYRQLTSLLEKQAAPETTVQLSPEAGNLELR